MIVGEQIGETTGRDDALHPDVPACREQLGRMLRSSTFLKAPRLCSLLRYIVEKTLDHQIDDLTEQQIGIYVFQRTPGYSSADDTIVRGSARHLRSRLEQYYREEGRHDPIEIFIPKGGYVASFRHANVEPYTAPSEESGSILRQPVAEIPVTLQQSAKWPWQAWITVATLAVALISLSTIFWMRRAPAAEASRAPGPALLWANLFQSDKRTIIVPGDAALDSYIGWETKPVSLLDYTTQDYQKHIGVSRPPSMDVPLGIRSVTPMADLRLVSELVQIPPRLKPALESQTQILYARDLTVSDTRDANLILIGAETFNPWVTLYQPQLDYKIEWSPHDDIYTVTDRAPKAGEASKLTYRRGVSGGSALTLIAFVENTQGSGNVLLVEGTSMGTTYGALTFLTSERLWAPVIKQATDGSGHLHNFEALLSSDFVRGVVTKTRVVSTHIH